MLVEGGYIYLGTGKDLTEWNTKKKAYGNILCKSETVWIGKKALYINDLDDLVELNIETYEQKCISLL